MVQRGMFHCAKCGGCPWDQLAEKLVSVFGDGSVLPSRHLPVQRQVFSDSSAVLVPKIFRVALSFLTGSL